MPSYPSRSHRLLSSCQPSTVSVPKSSFLIRSSDHLGVCLGPLRLLEQNIIVWGAHKQQAFVSHISEGWESEIKALADSMSGENPLPVHRRYLCTVSSHGGDGGLSGGSL